MVLRASFLLNMMSFPEMIRNVAVVGHLHHGKTALMDMLVFETHKLVWDADKPVSSSIPISFSYPLKSASSYVTPTPIASRANERYLSNHLLCHLFSELPVESPILYTSSTHRDTSISLTRLLPLLDLLMVSYKSLTSLKA